MSLLLRILLCNFVLDKLYLPILIHLLLRESIRSSEYDDSTLPFGPFCVRQYDARCSWQSTVRLAEENTHPVHIWMKFCEPPLQGLSNHHQQSAAKKACEACGCGWFLRLNLQRLEWALAPVLEFSTCTSLYCSNSENRSISFANMHVYGLFHAKLT